MTTDDIRAAAERLIREATIHRVEYGTESRHVDDILLVAPAALAGLDQAANIERLTEQLRIATAMLEAIAACDKESGGERYPGACATAADDALIQISVVE